MGEEHQQATADPGELELTAAGATQGSLALALEQAALEPEPGDESTRKRRRSRSRARTISIRRLSKTELNRGRELYPEDEHKHQGHYK